MDSNWQYFQWNTLLSSIREKDFQVYLKTKYEILVPAGHPQLYDELLELVAFV